MSDDDGAFAQRVFERMVAEGDMVLDQLDRCAAQHPGKRYLHDGEGGEHLSFAECQRQSDRIAAGLVAMGLPVGAPVAVLTRQSRFSALAMFAIWRAGGVFAPVNFNFRGDLLAYPLNDTAPFALITDESFAPVLAAVADRLTVRRLIVHPARTGEHAPQPPAWRGFEVTHWRELAEHGGPAPRILRGPLDAANVVYTSGSTGPSKGVLQPFRWMNHYGFPGRALSTSDDVLYCDLPLYHVGGAFAVVTRALWLGNTVGLWDRFSPTRFWDRIAECGASQAILLDVMTPWLMSAAPRADDRANTLGKVHMQPLPQHHHAVAQRFGFDFVTCGFGQTESGSGFAAAIDEFGGQHGTPPELWRGLSKPAYRERCREMRRTLVDGRETLPKGFMGQPNPVLEVGVFDGDDRPVAPGQVGQLCFRPRFPGLLMQEYLRKPEVTAQALRNGWFHTGDAIRELPERPGNYAFVDRIGGFLRVRGENVSSFDVEAQIASHPAVRAAAVVPVPAREGDEEDIGAFVEARDGQAVTEAELREHVATRLPKYMQPRHWRIVAALPLTPTNKVEKYKLKAQLIEELQRDGH